MLRAITCELESHVTPVKEQCGEDGFQSGKAEVEGPSREDLSLRRVVSSVDGTEKVEMHRKLRRRRMGMRTSISFGGMGFCVEGRRWGIYGDSGERWNQGIRLKENASASEDEMEYWIWRREREGGRAGTRKGIGSLESACVVLMMRNVTEGLM